MGSVTPTGRRVGRAELTPTLTRGVLGSSARPWSLRGLLGAVVGSSTSYMGSRIGPAAPMWGQHSPREAGREGAGQAGEQAGRSQAGVEGGEGEEPGEGLASLAPPSKGREK